MTHPRILRGAHRWFCASVAIVAALLADSVYARGVSPYLPLDLPPSLEQDIQYVLLLGGRPLTRRPIAAATVLDALSDACPIDASLCSRVRAYLDAYMDTYGLTHAAAELAATRDSERTLPNRRGMGVEDEWALSLQGYYQLGDYVLLQLGGIAYPGETLPVGSWLSIGYEYAQLDVGYREHWWSPLRDSSMLIGTQTQPMPGLTLSNYTPISRLGLQYEVFLGRMSYTDNIAYQGRTTSGYPRLAGVHVSIEPVPGWSLAATRVMQFGGGERKRSFRDFLNAFFQPARYDNVSDELTRDEEFGNQAAAFSSTFLVPTRRPFAIYFEYAGEDGARREGWRLGNSALSIGVSLPQLTERVGLRYEVTDWQNGWYVHGIYPRGLSSDGHVIGHWGGDERVLRDGVGAQSHTLMLDWQPSFGGLMELRYRTLENERYSAYDYERGHDVSLRYSRIWQELVYGVEANLGRDVFGEEFRRLGAFVYYAPGQREHARQPYQPLPDRGVRRAELFVDAGLSAVRLQYDPSDGGVTPKSEESSVAPHIGVGVRRRVSQRNDIGVRVEFEEVDGTAVLGVRALDYRFRAGEKLAFSAFMGALRYDGPTAAYGYYGGLGVQWRELFPGVTLNLDLKGTDKVLRDALLPDDPKSVWGDVLYKLHSASLYLSYSFR